MGEMGVMGVMRIPQPYHPPRFGEMPLGQKRFVLSHYSYKPYKPYTSYMPHKKNTQGY